MRPVLAATFVLVPLVEIWAILQVGQLVGPWWTIALLVLDSAIGAWLIKREGGRAWQALRQALRDERHPPQTLMDLSDQLPGRSLALDLTAHTLTRAIVVAARTAARDDPATWQPILATALNNQANRLAQAGRPTDGLAPINETVDAYRALAQADPTRFLPDLPTLDEAGVPGYAAAAWYAMAAPAATPPAVVRLINQHVNRALVAPDVARRIETLGADTTIATPEEVDRFIAAEARKWQQVVEVSGVRAG